MTCLPMNGPTIRLKREEILARVDSARRHYEWEERESAKQLRALQACCAHLRIDVSTSQLGVERVCLDCGAEL